MSLIMSSFGARFHEKAAQNSFAALEKAKRRDLGLTCQQEKLVFVKISLKRRIGRIYVVEHLSGGQRFAYRDNSVS